MNKIDRLVDVWHPMYSAVKVLSTDTDGSIEMLWKYFLHTETHEQLRSTGARVNRCCAIDKLPLESGNESEAERLKHKYTFAPAV